MAYGGGSESEDGLGKSLAWSLSSRSFMRARTYDWHDDGLDVGLGEEEDSLEVVPDAVQECANLRNGAGRGLRLGGGTRTGVGVRFWTRIHVGLAKECRGKVLVERRNVVSLHLKRERERGLSTRG